MATANIQCSCGAVQVEISGVPILQYICHCKQCGTFLFAEVPGRPVRGVNGELLPQGMFEPQFHIQCRYAAAPIEDHLPHYRDLPARFGGSDELTQ